CWLFTRTGGNNSWLPFDLGQEENICDIKASFLTYYLWVNYRSMGPSATMEYMGKVSPAIPALRKVQRHMEQMSTRMPAGITKSDDLPSVLTICTP
ncbi:hypothetical protein B0H10DRAFT_1811955, partial [Mycena sp. CBHHK59/15]